MPAQRKKSAPKKTPAEAAGQKLPVEEGFTPRDMVGLPAEWVADFETFLDRLVQQLAVGSQLWEQANRLRARLREEGTRT